MQHNQSNEITTPQKPANYQRGYPMLDAASGVMKSTADKGTPRSRDVVAVEAVPPTSPPRQRQSTNTDPKQNNRSPLSQLVSRNSTSDTRVSDRLNECLVFSVSDVGRIHYRWEQNEDKRSVSTTAVHGTPIYKRPTQDHRADKEDDALPQPTPRSEIPSEGMGSDTWRKVYGGRPQSVVKAQGVLPLPVLQPPHTQEATTKVEIRSASGCSTPLFSENPSTSSSPVARHSTNRNSTSSQGPAISAGLFSCFSPVASTRGSAYDVLSMSTNPNSTPLNSYSSTGSVWEEIVKSHTSTILDASAFHHQPSDEEGGEALSPGQFFNSSYEDDSSLCTSPEKRIESIDTSSPTERDALVESIDTEPPLPSPSSASPTRRVPVALQSRNRSSPLVQVQRQTTTDRPVGSFKRFTPPTPNAQPPLQFANANRRVSGTTNTTIDMNRRRPTRTTVNTGDSRVNGGAPPAPKPTTKTTTTHKIVMPPTTAPSNATTVVVDTTSGNSKEKSTRQWLMEQERQQPKIAVVRHNQTPVQRAREEQPKQSYLVVKKSSSHQQSQAPQHMYQQQQPVVQQKPQPQPPAAQLPPREPPAAARPSAGPYHCYTPQYYTPAPAPVSRGPGLAPTHSWPPTYQRSKSYNKNAHHPLHPPAPVGQYQPQYPQQAPRYASNAPVGEYFCYDYCRSPYDYHDMQRQAQEREEWDMLMRHGTPHDRAMMDPHQQVPMFAQHPVNQHLQKTPAVRPRQQVTPPRRVSGGAYASTSPRRPSPPHQQEEVRRAPRGRNAPTPLPPPLADMLNQAPSADDGLMSTNPPHQRQHVNNNAPFAQVAEVPLFRQNQVLGGQQRGAQQQRHVTPPRNTQPHQPATSPPQPQFIHQYTVPEPDTSPLLEEYCRMRSNVPTPQVQPQQQHQARHRSPPMAPERPIWMQNQQPDHFAAANNHLYPQQPAPQNYQQHYPQQQQFGDGGAAGYQAHGHGQACYNAGGWNQPQQQAVFGANGAAWYSSNNPSPPSPPPQPQQQHQFQPNQFFAAGNGNLNMDQVLGLVGQLPFGFQQQGQVQQQQVPLQQQGVAANAGNGGRPAEFAHRLHYVYQYVLPPVNIAVHPQIQILGQQALFGGTGCALVEGGSSCSSCECDHHQSSSETEKEKCEGKDSSSSPSDQPQGKKREWESDGSADSKCKIKRRRHRKCSKKHSCNKSDDGQPADDNQSTNKKFAAAHARATAGGRRFAIVASVSARQASPTNDLISTQTNDDSCFDVDSITQGALWKKLMEGGCFGSAGELSSSIGGKNDNGNLNCNLNNTLEDLLMQSLKKSHAADGSLPDLDWSTVDVGFELAEFEMTGSGWQRCEATQQKPGLLGCKSIVGPAVVPDLVPDDDSNSSVNLEGGSATTCSIEPATNKKRKTKKVKNLAPLERTSCISDLKAYLRGTR
eukprot:TRINITY_DN65655_c0_g1_i1.p1 TRINITY_DN65655_c0_g1~~TRINITY_DN65655_c0_g1_i1.p1  ORF type:complete len:1418 (+),score=267.89 TRINITY_DN65655_c0_g1_i1:355-4608(+)